MGADIIAASAKTAATIHQCLYKAQRRQTELVETILNGIAKNEDVDVHRVDENLHVQSTRQCSPTTQKPAFQAFSHNPTTRGATNVALGRNGCEATEPGLSWRLRGWSDAQSKRLGWLLPILWVVEVHLSWRGHHGRHARRAVVGVCSRGRLRCDNWAEEVHAALKGAVVMGVGGRGSRIRVEVPRGRLAKSLFRSFAFILLPPVAYRTLTVSLILFALAAAFAAAFATVLALASAFAGAPLATLTLLVLTPNGFSVWASGRLRAHPLEFAFRTFAFAIGAGPPAHKVAIVKQMFEVMVGRGQRQ